MTANIADQTRRLRRVARAARLMDTAVRLPGGFRLGADSIVGLVPGVGDTATVLVSLWIVNEARKMGLPTHKLTRMLGNVGLDYVVGAVPILGDVFDAVYKANRRNLNMILDHFGHHDLTDLDDIDERTMKDVTPDNNRRG
ncbi:DUF4112 domain-containing protein [Notoacmeibacter sp. MSK16QG-6]|uniref:DUF4112 domain-containing protein n=1 Tax=Notoacmeibacter sp. MSK16QG-6 TaxID=2957982 RepID=UPI00209DEB55|nr:DUF4112 domain-containing protein [Notoacmeibacter sp. MSK16QG-6]MCP1199955.1 DUF4112 domain-containing protein [Notoacmeibacter sp. MSK16QG-6]